jgi:hypothetical protein
MDQSSTQNVDQRKTPRSKQTEKSPNNPAKTFKLIHKIEQSNIQEQRNSTQGGAVHAELPTVFSYPDRSGHLIAVDRSELTRPSISRTAALTQANLQRLQMLLVNPTPMTRWQFESIKTGAWNSLSEFAARQDAQRLLPEEKGAVREQ